MSDETDIPARIALHACCGPCLLEPYDDLASTGAEVVVVYANPNIHPAAEYERRRETLAEYARGHSIEVVELEYRPEAWETSVAGESTTAGERCLLCYRLRFGLVARWAALNDFDGIASTLTVSPYQDAEAITLEGERAAASAGLVYVRRDYRDRYTDATRRSRELGMYRQNYCGCRLSELEAAEERAQRKAARRAAGR